jgi:hypothetical protein
MNKILYPVFLLILTPFNLANAFDIPGSKSNDFDYVAEEDTWKENSLGKFPAFPADSDFIQVPFHQVNSAFSVWIATKTINTGDDHVVRYVVQLRSKTGASNTFYEGLRCDTQEYKIYAYGTGKQFTQYNNSQWRHVSSARSSRYRDELVNHFLCANLLPEDENEMLNRLKSRTLQYRDPTDI